MKRRSVITSFIMMVWVCMFLTGAVSAEPGRFAFVLSEGDNNLSIIDLNTEKIVKTLPTGKTPHALAFTKGGKGCVNNRGTRDLTRY